MIPAIGAIITSAVGNVAKGAATAAVPTVEALEVIGETTAAATAESAAAMASTAETIVARIESAAPAVALSEQVLGILPESLQPVTGEVAAVTKLPFLDSLNNLPDPNPPGLSVAEPTPSLTTEIPSVDGVNPPDGIVPEISAEGGTLKTDVEDVAKTTDNEEPKKKIEESEQQKNDELPKQQDSEADQRRLQELQEEEASIALRISRYKAIDKPSTEDVLKISELENRQTQVSLEITTLQAKIALNLVTE